MGRLWPRRYVDAFIRRLLRLFDDNGEVAPVEITFTSRLFTEDDTDRCSSPSIGIQFAQLMCHLSRHLAPP